MKKSFKKILVIGIISIIGLGITACTKSDDNNEKDETKNTDKVVNVSLRGIADEIKEAYGEDYIPNMEFDEVFIKDTLGLSPDDYEEIIAEGPMVSLHIDNLIAIKAKEGKADAVEKALNDYRSYLINDTVMYPMNAIKIQASEVIRHGDYVFFSCLGVMDAEDGEEEEDLLKKAKEKNKIAVGIINNFFD